jgi:tetratricopeptide (TPR) repeat protein
MIVSFSFCARITTNIDLGNKCARAGLWKEAIFRWERALQDTEEKAIIYNNLGIAYEKLGEKEKALEQYKKSLSLDPDNKYTKRNLSRCKGEGKRIENFLEGKKVRKNGKKK